MRALENVTDVERLHMDHIWIPSHLQANETSHIMFVHASFVYLIATETASHPGSLADR